MKLKLKKGFTLFMLFFLPFSLVTFQSCNKDDGIDDFVNQLLSILDQTGWLQDKEKMDDIPEDITPFDDETGTLAAKVDLENKFPPIGDQGQYGTCVAWSVGYNLKTSLNAIEKGWTTSQLLDKANQTSPKDLWMAIDSKGANCQGTNFEPAMDALIASGAASLSDVPYNMGSCSGTKVGNANNKLANYRKIASETDGLTVENFKGYLNAGRPISIGAKLGDRFMDWSSSAVISSDTYNAPEMQHAYHAMVLVGYDDAKNAFRVRNSWGPTWGDNGSIWIDYDFFCRSFCFAAFVAQNVNSISAGSGGITDKTSGDDLLAYSAKDQTSDDPDYTRMCSYKVYNSGTTTISASKNWTITYMYYDAKDASKYEVIFEDRYTTEFGGNKGDFDNLPDGESDALMGGFWNNVDVTSGQLVGGDNFPNGTEVYYDMPLITGEYYLVVMADAFDVIREANEDNNFYFITAANGKPLQIVNGVIQNMAKSGIAIKSAKKPALYSNTETQTLVKPGNMNTYTPSELRAMLIHDKKTGKLDAKLKKFRTKGTHQKVKRVRI